MDYWISDPFPNPCIKSRLTAALTCPLELLYLFRCLMNSDLEVFPTAVSVALPFAKLSQKKKHDELRPVV